MTKVLKKARPLSAICAKCNETLQLGVGHICKAPGAGRPRMGTPFPVTLTDEQKRWLYGTANLSGESAAAVVRRLIEEAMKAAS